MGVGVLCNGEGKRKNIEGGEEDEREGNKDLKICYQLIIINSENNTNIGLRWLET